MTECSVHAELLSSSYDSPGCRCSARTHPSAALLLRLDAAAAGPRRESASSASSASSQPHAIISEMTANGSRHFVSRVFLADRRLEIIEGGWCNLQENHCRQADSKAKNLQPQPK